MSMTVPKTDVENRWELASLLPKDLSTPMRSLKEYFDAAIRTLEEKSNSQIPSSVQKKVWEAISKEKLKALNQELTSLIFRNVLNVFHDHQITQMLANVKTNAPNEKRNERLLAITTLIFTPEIEEAMIQKTHSIGTQVAPKILEALKKEGICKNSAS